MAVGNGELNESGVRGRKLETNMKKSKVMKVFKSGDYREQSGQLIGETMEELACPRCLGMDIFSSTFPVFSFTFEGMSSTLSVFSSTSHFG